MRKEAVVTIEDGGVPKRFKIRQMAATRTQDFVIRVALAVGGGADGLDADFSNMAGLNYLQALLAALQKADYDKIKPLMDELLTCCHHLPEKNGDKVETPCSPALLDGFIDDFRKQ
jgi:hypothetical protein